MDVDVQVAETNLLKKRHGADVRKWLFYLIMWIGVLILGLWLGLRYHHVEAGLIAASSLISVALFYSLFILGWHVKSAVHSLQTPSPKDVQRVERLLDPLCQRASIPMPQVFIIPSDAGNACAVGIFKRSRSIGVTHGALQLLTDEELTAVLAHEVTHLQRKDIFFDGWWVVLTGLVIWIGALMVGLGIASALSAQASRNQKERESGAGLGILLVAVGVVIGVVCAILLQLVEKTVSRRAEYMADNGTVLLTGRAKPLIRALSKLEQTDPVFESASALSMIFSVSAVPRGHWWERWFDTHPPTKKRIKRLEKLGRKLGEL